MQSVVGLVSEVSQAHLQLEHTTAQIYEAHALQVETTQSAARLTETFSELTILAQEEMHNLTGTAAELHERLLIMIPGNANRVWLDWTKATALYMLEIILRGKWRYFDTA